jgi:predicted membrane metal-binding protein
LGRVGPAPFTEGQRIAAPLRLHPATGFRNPRTYDYAAHLALEGIDVVATTRAESVTPLDDPAPPWSVRVKRGSVTAIGRALPPASAALLAGLLPGDRTELLRDIDDAFPARRRLSRGPCLRRSAARGRASLRARGPWRRRSG